MKIMLFLGSGISYPSGMPSVDCITTDLLNNEWSRHTDGTYFQGKNPSIYLENQYLAKPEQQTLATLANIMSSYFTKRNSNHKVNYEDLFYVLRQLHEEDSRVAGNPVIGPFYDQVKDILKPMIEDLSNRRYPGVKQYEFYELCDLCLELINDVVQTNLRTPQSVKGLDLILELVSDDDVSQITLVTLNHDLLIEKFLEDSNVDYIDGFIEDSNGTFGYQAELFAEKAKVKLLKLHGSVNWYSVESPTGYQYVKVKQSSPRQSLSLNQRPVFLCGTDNKPMSYAYGLFQDLHYLWQQMLYDNNLMIMSGYGWKDSGISSRVLNWLSQPENTLILLARDISKLRKDCEANLAIRYDNLLVRDRIIPVRKWFFEISWQQVKSRYRLWVDSEKESSLLDSVLKTACYEFDDLELIADSDKLYDFLTEVTQQILEKCRVLIEEQLGSTRAQSMMLGDEYWLCYNDIKIKLINNSLNIFKNCQGTITSTIARNVLGPVFHQIVEESRSINFLANMYSNLLK